MRSLIISLNLPVMLFRKIGREDRLDVEKKHAELHSGMSGIRCPLCKWRPKRSSQWVCSDNVVPENFFNGCGTRWNTFETRGICPGCGHQWVWTQCLSCGRASRHEDWYETDPHR